MHRYMIHILKLTQILQMLLKSNRRMHCLCCERQWRWTHFLSVFWLWLLAPASPKALGYFLGDTKAVLNGCGDHWTLQDRTAMPLLFQMTVCVDIRVVVPGAWVAFSYSSIYAPRPELGLEGDDEALYGWLLRVRHRFPVRLSPKRWHRVCLRRDVLHDSFSLEVDGRALSERTVIAQAIPPSGSLWLGCRPRDRPPGTALGEVELYLFRMWADLGDHGLCEDGTVIGWNSRYWGLTSPKARQTDPSLLCEHRWLRHGVRVRRRAPGPQSRAERSHTTSIVKKTLLGSKVNCDISQLCSNKNVHFWMLISVTEMEEDRRNEDVQQWVSNALRCHNRAHGASCLQHLCQAVKVNCKIEENKGDATCSVLVTLRRACSAPQLKPAIVSALNAEDNHMRGKIIGEVIQVGLCEDVNPSSGKYIRCQSTLPLDDICRNNTQFKLTCSLIESNSNSDEWPTTESNSMTCGSSKLPVHTLSKFDLNWATSDRSSESKSDEESHECGANKNLFVVLVENCTSTTAQSSTQPTKQPNSNESTADSSEADSTEKPHMTTATTAAVQQTNALKGTTQPTPTTPLTINSRTQSSTAKPVLQISSQNMTVTLSDSRTVESTALSDHATLPSVNSTLEMTTTALVDSSPEKTLLPNNKMSTTISTFTASPKLKTEYNTTTANKNRSQHNGTTMKPDAGVSTATAFPNYTMMNNETTATKNYTTAFSKVTTDNNISKVDNNGTHNITSSSRYTTHSSITPSLKHTMVNNVTTSINSYKTPSKNNSTEYKVTSASSSGNQHNSTTDTSYINVESLNNLTTPTKNSTVDDMTSVVSNSTGNHLPNTTELKVTTTAETTKSHEAKEQALGSLLDQTTNVSQLNSSQMVQMTGQLEKLLDGPTVSQAMGQNAVNIISNLMESNLQALSTCANKLVRLIDDLSLKLVVSGDKEVVSSNSLVLAVWKVNGTNFTATFVDIFNTQDIQIRRFQSERSRSALGSVFLPWSLTTGLSPEQQQEASRVQFTYYTKPTLFHDSGLDNNTLVSSVLGSSVANLSIKNLSENIQFTIQNPMHGNYSVSCVFWDFSLNDGGGGWSKAGCFLVNTTADDTTCSCNHLTSFAILLDLSREGLTDPKEAQILSYITYVGCGISSIFLAITLLTYLLFEKLLRDIPAKILVQFCMSLLLLNLVFMLDGWLALYTVTGLCISTAFFLHYFLLTSFTWAGLEALHMYLSVIKVFTPYLSRYMLKFSLMGWGIPLIVVITVISVDKDNYGLVTYGKYANGSTDDFCWIRNDIAFYVGVVAYFLLIFALCLLVFIMVMVQLARIKKQNPHNQSPNRGLLTDMRSITGIIILLGLTWGCALFAWGPVHLPFTYLFSIFNSLQGFFVFVFHCAAKENVRRQWKTHLCCGRLRLAENSEWSRMATQNNKTISFTTSITPTPHFPSRSSSLISDGTSSSGSVLADSGISDGFSSDVVLNEIHRQNMPVKTASKVHW